jgi:hypothetical protein
MFFSTFKALLGNGGVEHYFLKRGQPSKPICFHGFVGIML